MTVANSVTSQPEEMVVNCVDELNDSAYDEVPPSPPSHEEQKNLIRDSTKATLNAGDTWYLVDIHWYKQWKKFIEFSCSDRGATTEHPGPIDNSPLYLMGCSKLKEHLLDGSDYKLINEVGWKSAVAWYGVVGDQPPIKRTVVEQGIYNKQLKVEVYLIELKLSMFTDLERVSVKEFSKCTTVGDVVEEMKVMFGVSDEETRVWNKFMSNTYELIHKMDQTLQDSGIGSGQMLVLEQKNENNEWPRHTRTRSLSSSSGMSISSPVESAPASGTSNAATSATYSPFSSNGYGNSRQ